MLLNLVSVAEGLNDKQSMGIASLILCGRYLWRPGLQGEGAFS